MIKGEHLVDSKVDSTEDEDLERFSKALFDPSTLKYLDLVMEAVEKEALPTNALVADTGAPCN